MPQKKADAVAAAQSQNEAASARWTAAVRAEAEAFGRARFGEQMERLEHSYTLDELKSARKDTLDATQAIAAAEALPDEEPA